jgi:AraC-like DNA-binding protein
MSAIPLIAEVPARSRQGPLSANSSHSRGSGRTLFQYFRDFRGTSPMRYLRDARFEKVRDALKRAQSEEGVAELAMKWGFSHLGRFAVEYRKRFGESPSETLWRRQGAQ